MITDRGDPLPLVHADCQRHESHGLPSRVPDWSAFVPFNPSPYDRCLFRARGNQPVTADPVQGSTPTLKGMIVDTVSTGNRMVWEHQRVYDALLRITSRREMIGTNEGIRRAYGECGDISNLNGNFWRTIFGDSLIARDGQSHRLSSGDIDTISSWWNWFVLLSKDSPNRSEWASVKPSPEYQQVFETFTERTRARRFFITENDRMGMGVSIINAVDAEDLRSEVRVGDVICLLYGSNLPVVLRRLDQQSLQQSVSFQHNTELVQIYSYIGTCCVHGIMDGEALAKPRSGNENGISSLHIGGFKRAGPEVETDRQSKIFEELPGPLQLLITRAYGYGTETKQ